MPISRHGPKPGCQEAEAFSILEAEAEALNLFKLEAKAKAKARLFVENQIAWQVEALVNQEAEAEAFENHEAKAEARLSKI